MTTLQQSTSDIAYHLEIILPKMEYKLEAMQKLREEFLDLIAVANGGTRRSAELKQDSLPFSIPKDTRGRILRKVDK